MSGFLQIKNVGSSPNQLAVVLGNGVLCLCLPLGLLYRTLFCVCSDVASDFSLPPCDTCALFLEMGANLARRKRRYSIHSGVAACPGRFTASFALGFAKHKLRRRELARRYKQGFSVRSPTPPCHQLFRRRATFYISARKSMPACPVSRGLRPSLT